jgi:hypothetical protein
VLFLFIIPNQIQVEDLVLGANTSIKGDIIIIQLLGQKRKRKHNTKQSLGQRKKENIILKLASRRRLRI